MRTIEHIIFKNVKYCVGRKAAETEELPLKADTEKPKWDSSKLAIGNWFSSVSYLRVKEIQENEVKVVDVKG